MLFSQFTSLASDRTVVLIDTCNHITPAVIKTYMTIYTDIFETIQDVNVLDRLKIVHIYNIWSLLSFLDSLHTTNNTNTTTNNNSMNIASSVIIIHNSNNLLWPYLNFNPTYSSSSTSSSTTSSSVTLDLIIATLFLQLRRYTSSSQQASVIFSDIISPYSFYSKQANPVTNEMFDILITLHAAPLLAMYPGQESKLEPSSSGQRRYQLGKCLYVYMC